MESVGEKGRARGFEKRRDETIETLNEQVKYKRAHDRDNAMRTSKPQKKTITKQNFISFFRGR